MILSFWFAKGAFGYLIQSQSTRLLGPPFTSQFVIPSKARNPLFASDATNAGPALSLKQLVIPSKARNPLFASDATNAWPALSPPNNLSFRAKRGIRCSPATRTALGLPCTSNNLSFRARRGIRCLPATPRTLSLPLQQFVIPSKARNPLFAGDGTDARPAPSNNLSFRAKRVIRCSPATTNACPFTSFKRFHP